MDGLSFFLGYLAAIFIRAVVDVARRRAAERRRSGLARVYAAGFLSKSELRKCSK